jgi:hypothetical protein
VRTKSAGTCATRTVAFRRTAASGERITEAQKEFARSVNVDRVCVDRYGVDIRAGRSACQKHDGDNPTACAYMGAVAFCHSHCGTFDAIDLVRAREGYGYREAVRVLCSLFGGPSDSDTLPPVPCAKAKSATSKYGPRVTVSHDAEFPNLRERVGERHAARYFYDTADCQVDLIIDRFEYADGKRFSPWTYRDGDWRNVGARHAPGELSPLYRIPDLNLKPDAVVVYVEGEKACDAARELFTDHDHLVAVTHPGGSNAWKSVDLSPLRDRRVVVLADADDPGRKMAEGLVHRKDGMSSPPIISAIIPRPGVLPKGWDIADGLPADIALDDFLAMLRGGC